MLLYRQTLYFVSMFNTTRGFKFTYMPFNVVKIKTSIGNQWYIEIVCYISSNFLFGIMVHYKERKDQGHNSRSNGFKSWTKGQPTLSFVYSLFLSPLKDFSLFHSFLSFFLFFFISLSHLSLSRSQAYTFFFSQTKYARKIFTQSKHFGCVKVPWEITYWSWIWRLRGWNLIHSFL